METLVSEGTMRIVRCAFVAILVTALSLPLTGCGLFRSSAGVEEYTDANGVTRVRVNERETSPLDVASTIAGVALTAIGVPAIVGRSAINGLKLWIRHREILAHGQKDDNINGIPDDQEETKPPAAPPA